MTIPQLGTEFLWRVVNELSGRRFEFIETALCIPPEQAGAEMVSVSGYGDDILKCLPEITREFAAKIQPRLTCCYKLGPPRWSEDRYSTSHDLSSGLCIRCFKAWDPMRSKLMYRFDAAFS